MKYLLNVVLRNPKGIHKRDFMGQAYNLKLKIMGSLVLCVGGRGRKKANVATFLDLKDKHQLSIPLEYLVDFVT